MVTFFRRMRQQLLSERRLGDYLRYALGEIVLIVAGILLALQINDWNDERLEQQQVRDYAHALVADLAADQAMLEPVDAQIRVVMRQADELASYTRGKPLEAVSNAEIFLLTFGTNYRPYAWNRSALERLKSTGALRAMRDQELARMIAQYDALTHHLDQDYEDDSEAITQARASVNRVRNMNYPGIERVLAHFAGIPDDGYEKAFFAVRDTDLFRDMRTNDLPLLTRDPAELAALVNSSLEIREMLRPRVEIEYPRLRRMAGDIAARIGAEYP